MQTRVVQQRRSDNAPEATAGGGPVGAPPSRDLSATLFVLQRTQGNRFVRRMLGGGKLRRGSSPAGRYNTEGMRTICDVKVRADEVAKLLAGQRVHTVGDGKHVIVKKIPELESKSPCVHEACMAHENKHIQNAGNNCSEMKKCVDKKSSRWRSLGLGEPTISSEEYEECRKTYGDGLMLDCVADEKSAYEVSIKKAQELSAQPRCAAEKPDLEANIKGWLSIKDNAPNCAPNK